MPSIFIFTLVGHVVMGLLGVVALFIVLLTLLQKPINLKKLRIYSLVTVTGYFLSWLLGGYYYWFYYGSNVKPIINAGQYNWAHLIVMEAKEHVFLLVPVMSIVILSISLFAGTKLQTDATFVKATIHFVVTTLVLAVLITLAGIIISGGAQ